MRAIVAQFKQESNSFSPVTCGMDMFEASDIRHGDALFELEGSCTEIAGVLHTLKNADVEIIPALSMYSMSSGPVERSVCDYFIGQLLACIKAAGPVDGLVLVLHGATQLTDAYDGIGVILQAAREALGEEAIITVSTDYHANITHKCIALADAICGFQTYPHIDQFETGQRAADMFLRRARGQNVCLAHIKLPMIHQAEACMTNAGPMQALMDYARAQTSEHGIVDFSIYQMQPWLDVPEGGATVLVIAQSFELAAQKAKTIAQRYWEIREELSYKLYDLDEMIDIAFNNTAPEPIVISDSADSPSAGSTGDSTAILARLLERKIDIPALLSIADADAAARAAEIGVGNTGAFTLGGKMDTARYKPISITAYVKSLHDGVVHTSKATIGGNRRIDFGKAAVLCVGNISILVSEMPQLNSHPQGYIAFGMNIGQARLIVVKSALQYREYYAQYTNHMYNVDTPGASSANLFSFAFKQLPRPIYPFDDVAGYVVDGVHYGRGHK